MQSKQLFTSRQLQKRNGEKKTAVTTRKSTLNGHNFVPTYVARSEEWGGAGHIFLALRHAVFLQFPPSKPLLLH